MNSNVTFSTVEFSTSYASNVVSGMLDDAIFAVVIVSLVVSAINCHLSSIQSLNILDK